MAKKFGKFLLTTAAIGAAVATAYHFLNKKEMIPALQDDDFDDFSDDLDDDTDAASRTYVQLNRENSEEEEIKSEEPVSTEAASDESKEKEFTPLTKQVADTVEEEVEEFFDEEE